MLWSKQLVKRQRGWDKGLQLHGTNISLENGRLEDDPFLFWDVPFSGANMFLFGGRVLSVYFFRIAICIFQPRIFKGRSETYSGEYKKGIILRH